MNIGKQLRYVHSLRSAWDSLKLTNNSGKSQLKALGFLYALEESADWALL